MNIETILVKAVEEQADFLRPPLRSPQEVAQRMTQIS